MQTAEETSDDERQVLVAGGGIGGLEAILALREIAGDSLSISLLSPAREYTPVPLAVVEPFREDSVERPLPLQEFCDEHGVEFIQDGLAEVWPGQQRVLTDTGTELYYDALLLSAGAKRRPLVEDALTFRGFADAGALRDAAARLGEGGGSAALVAAPGVEWALPLYEIAFMLADRLDDPAGRVHVLTWEEEPLAVFGEATSATVRGLLDDAGIRFSGGVDDPAAALADLEPDVTIALPGLYVPDIPGVGQANGGFVPIDRRMRVPGPERVWAVGDITFSPIKQGGLAAQQADVAAADIAAELGEPVEVPPYAPVLRAALITADGPLYLRSGSPDQDGQTRAPLWWPPAKVAGRRLAPYLTRRAGGLVSSDDLDDLTVDAAKEADHQEALELALRWADLDAESGELRRALHWLDVAEGLALTLPAGYAEKRERWRAELD